MSWPKITVLAAIFIALGAGIFGLFEERSKLTGEANELRAEFEVLSADNKNLSAKIEYFQKPENLLKEIKSQFNYREAGEGLIIIVPSATSTEQ